ncbi:MAG TPA: hypothetical protein ENJ82_16605, partial [Bacteroidetes bacterium]|nr:hypothetical protein [Bacteroidota bacterium]
MEKLAGYDSIELLAEGPLFILARGKLTADGEAVLLKTPVSGEYRIIAERFLKAEFTLLQDIPLPEGVAAVRRLHGTVLELNNIPGIPLSTFLKGLPNGRCDISKGIIIAQNLSMLLFRLRQHRLLHLSIQPAQILVNPDNFQVCLTGFGIPISKLDITQIPPFLPYISPEQTGRVDRQPDFRSDLYALGATLYEIFTGSPPFPDQDKMGLIHSHLARLPLSPKAVIPGLAPRLSSAIMRLLTKNPADRFPSAASLHNELEQVRLGTELQSRPENEKDRFQLLDKLYGRADEFARLQNVLSASSQGQSSLFFISGNSGVGKSALIQRLGSQLIQDGGFFAAGKFEQYNQSTPFIALLNAFMPVLNRLLKLEDDELEIWRKRLQSSLGANAPVVASLLPEIELIIGKQKKLPVDESSLELANRLKKVMKDFMRQFGAADKPLLLFLDDLQWADHATFDLLHSLVNGQSLPYMMLVGAFHAKHLAEAHPLHAFLETCQEQEAFFELELLPLPETAINEMLCDVLHETPEGVASLARIVSQKSAGNPFFAREFVRRQYRAQLIQYDYLQNKWNWDEAGILQAGISGSAVELMVEMVEALPETEQQVLKFASFFTREFQEPTLVKLFALEVEPTHLALISATERGLILPAPNVPAETG